VVVGFGLAGAIAAIEAHDAGAKVLLLEKAAFPGGLSICAGGGARIADDADKSFAYLQATCAGTTADSVLRALAHGITKLERYVRKLAAPLQAEIKIVGTKGNYPLDGYGAWQCVEVGRIPGFEAAVEYPHVRLEGDVNGVNMFKLAHHHVERRR